MTTKQALSSCGRFLVYEMSSFSLNFPVLVRGSKFAVTGCFINTLNVCQDFVIHTTAKQLHIFALPPEAASVFDGIEK